MTSWRSDRFRFGDTGVDWHHWRIPGETEGPTVTPTGERATGDEFGMTELEEVTITGVPGKFWRLTKREY